jgi:hypothetical protein
VDFRAQPVNLENIGEAAVVSWIREAAALDEASHV